MSLFFSNPGEADIRALTTLGVNVKEGNAIGFFGTGFKIATAVVLRLGGSVSVWIGTDEYTFYAVPTMIRGREFGVVYLRRPDGPDQELGFTTELGKNWEPWMAYREFRCNQADENGGVPARRQTVEQTAGITTVVVNCRDLEEVHHESWKYFLTTEPREVLEELEVHEHRHPEEDNVHLFYRGVRIGQFGRPLLFTYNFTDTIRLTEDRTILHPHEVQRTWARSICHSSDKDFIRKILAPDIKYAESQLDFSNIYSASETFKDVAEEMLKQQPQNMNVTVRILLARSRRVDPYIWVDPNVVQAQMLMKAEAFCKNMGYDTTDTSIRIVSNLRHGVLGEVHGNDVYLSTRVFDMGTKMVAGTLLEEMLHIRHGVIDESREMQNLLLDKIVSAYEMQLGSAL